MGVQMNFETAKRVLESAALQASDRIRFVGALVAAKGSPETLTQIVHEIQRVAKASGGSGYQTKVARVIEQK